jgi:hypothetical protein
MRRKNKDFCLMYLNRLYRHFLSKISRLLAEFKVTMRLIFTTNIIIMEF